MRKSVMCLWYMDMYDGGQELSIIPKRVALYTATMAGLKLFFVSPTRLAKEATLGVQ